MCMQRWAVSSSLTSLCEKLGHDFSDPAILALALTHRSYCAENDQKQSNERLEFLGDSVLGLVVTNYIFNNYPQLPEGQLAKLRASVVSTVSLAEIGAGLGVGECLLLGKGEDQSGGREKESILADVVEALIGAVYIDAGWEKAEVMALALTKSAIVTAAEEPGGRDYKTQLQELAAKLNLGAPVYQLEGSGPDHDKRFVAATFVDGAVKGRGEGTSKKRAEQVAARSAYKNILNSIVKED